MILALSVALSTALATPPPLPTSAAWSAPLTKLDGGTLAPTELQGKAVVVVNVASKCGYTPQYEGLQALWESKKSAGLVVVGVPCNQFGGQEPGKPEEIAEFCKVNYGVGFPLLEKQDVNGDARSPLYKWLVSTPAGGNKDIAWNFEKFVVNRKGEVVGRFPSKVAPNDPAFLAAVDKALAP